MAIAVGLQAELRFEVTPDDVASALGSGDLPVLATPRLLAWCEAATLATVRPHLAPDQTSVGTRVQLEHTRATGVGEAVAVQARLVHVDGRLLRFDVAAEDVTGGLVGHAQVTRVVVDSERFLDRLQR